MTETTEPDDAAVSAAAELLRQAGWSIEPPADLRFGCHVELWSMPEGTEPDGCVIDDRDRSSCIYASDVQHKEQCRYWRRITPQSIKDARNGDS